MRRLGFAGLTILLLADSSHAAWLLEKHSLVKEMTLADSY